MTEPSRTTESMYRDNRAIRDIMHQVRELAVPDRATLAVGLVGHLATMMNRGQMTKLVAQLQEEAQRVQEVPPTRQRDDDGVAGTESGADDEHDGAARNAAASGAGRGKDDHAAERRAAGRREPADPPRTKPHGDVLASQVQPHGEDSYEGGVGQAGRGEFRSRRLL
jgi:hypothetical protein